MKLSDKKKVMAKKMHGMINGRVKASQKGRGSLEIPRGEKNEGNTMVEGKNENNRA